MESHQKQMMRYYFKIEHELFQGKSDDVIEIRGKSIPN